MRLGSIARIKRSLTAYYSALGFRGLLWILLAKLCGRELLFKMTTDGVTHPFRLRLGSTDVAVFRQVFLLRHYECSICNSPQVIIDAGANIGLSAIYFASRYPGARIVAIEPEASNYALLKRNVAPYPQIIPINAALWKEDGRIQLFDPGEGAHGFRISNSTESGLAERGFCDALTIESIVKRFDLARIDILKIDIEGSEKEVFESSAGWIQKVSVIMAETHDHSKPGCTAALDAATTEFDHMGTIGETIVRARKNQN